MALGGGGYPKTFKFYYIPNLKIQVIFKFWADQRNIQYYQNEKANIKLLVQG